MRILIVEDNQTLCEWMQSELIQQGYSVDICFEGDDGLRWMLKGVYDLVLLDRMLPRLDGIELLREARKAGIQSPVLMITALDSLSQRCEGLDSGADDYISKPFALDELLARVRALLRRPRGMDESTVWDYRGLVLSKANKTLRFASRECSLSKKEYDLFELFLRNAEKTLSRPTIFEYVWGPDAAVEESNLDNYIHFLRSRIRELKAPIKIKTIRSIGYQLVAEHVS